MRPIFGYGVLFSALTSLGCSDDGGDPQNSAGAGGSLAGSSGAGTTGGSAGSSSSGGAGSGGTSGSSAGGSSAGTAGTAGSAGTGGTGPLVGVCGQRGESTVNDTTFSGFEEYYIIDDEGFGEDICIVRFDVTRVGEAPPGCVDVEGVDCMWTHLVALSNPTVMLDMDGVCANSELAMDEAKMAEIDGTQVAYGYVNEFAGHVSVPMKYDDEAGTWGPNGSGAYSEVTELFRFNNLDGNCNYTPMP